MTILSNSSIFVAMQVLSSLPQSKVRAITIVLGLLIGISVGLLTANFGLALPLVFMGLSVFIALILAFFSSPKTALFTLVVYCFIYPILSREIGGLQYGIFIEVILLLAWIAALVKTPKENWAITRNDLFYLILGWFILSVMEIANPSGASVMGWLQEIRSAALYPLLIVPLAFVLFNTPRDLNIFLIIIILLSTLAALNGIKQLYIGPSPGEQRFLDEGGYITHVLWGKLRVFSFYSEAAQFGASQAGIGLIALILALGPFKKWKKFLLFIAAGLMMYGMLISGTRGALFALVVGAFVAILLSKKFKVLIIGGILMLGFIGFLKFTYIGNGNYQIYRLRSAVDPQDPSLNVRFNTQRVMREYMRTRPFGEGLGVIGAWGTKYNADKFISTVQPDSYYVKLWAMYGIVGLTLWLCMMVYILGECCGIVWKIRDPGLRTKVIALTAGFAGILFCSYGNEIINTMPSSFVAYISWVFVLMSPALEKEIEKNNLLTHQLA